MEASASFEEEVNVTPTSPNTTTPNAGHSPKEKHRKNAGDFDKHRNQSVPSAHHVCSVHAIYCRMYLL